MVMNLVMARDDARRNRDYATADDIREVLQADWGVAGEAQQTSFRPASGPSGLVAAPGARVPADCTSDRAPNSSNL